MALLTSPLRDVNDGGAREAMLEIITMSLDDTIIMGPSDQVVMAQEAPQNRLKLWILRIDR